ncbi:DUF1254 domain-containing protein [Marinobacter salinisoli]|uniref:DUF1254 domain-containing protein n=1 Tax=Marinobacter salinisoli TaxID=2769486 RepID=A0ABX7MSZ6_9GAMM|nr:DUF1214 domain-containing protein [Marinobacter salinisoli]QSP95515.1 DUF1254 domain-containing protein [Marinobacter salinisoli]
MKIKTACLVAAIAFLGLAGCKEEAEAKDIAPSAEKYGVSNIEFVSGMPTPESSKRIFDTMDYYSGVMVYLWSLPAVGLQGWENANIDMGANPELDGQISLYTGYDGAGGILTPNTAVTYLISFVNTETQGPAVWEIPPGKTAGYVGDFWQRPVLDVGVAGKDRGKGIKLLIVGPDQEVPEHDDSYTVVRSPTNVVWLGTRNMEPFGPGHDKVTAGFDSYPFNKPELAGRKKLSKPKDAFNLYQPHGMEFWKNLNTIIQREKMLDRDQFFYGMLKNLGIEKGKPFNPSPEQQELLIEAERVGYMMSINNTFQKRFEGSRYYDDKRWFTIIVMSPDQVDETHGQMFERASYFHEALGSTYAMKVTEPGPGSAYLGQYESPEGGGFDGAKTYKLVVPADVPADQFWAMTVYNSHSRTLIRNEKKQAEINSALHELTVNDDGSTTIYIGPAAPEGFENNWIQTKEGQTWFSYFRFYGPSMPYFDKSWQLNDIELVE